MPLIADAVLDAALVVLVTGGGRLDITHTEPTNYTQAITTFSVGNKIGLNIGAPAARSPSGRQVTVAAIIGGTLTATATSVADDAQFWAISDPSTSRLLAAGTLAAAQMQVSGGTFSLAAFTIGLAGA